MDFPSCKRSDEIVEIPSWHFVAAAASAAASGRGSPFYSLAAMKLQPLHDRFLKKMKEELPDWKFVSTCRHFQKKHSCGNLFAHVAFINHDDDFDATIDVAVEFISGRKRLCIVGAELGNIEGIGQFRFGVHSEQSAEDSAIQAVARLKRVGFPFLEHFANVRNVLATLKAGGPQAMLISPFLNLHAEQITSLESIENAG